VEGGGVRDTDRSLVALVSKFGLFPFSMQATGRA
jgi:hypothetical protein